MIKIEDDGTIYFSRADDREILFQANDGEYQFVKGDVITFRIFNKNGYTDKALLEKNITLSEDTNLVKIEITPADITKFCPQINKPFTCWYSISLNENVILGYDEDGAKQFIILPAKAKGEDDGNS